MLLRAFRKHLVPGKKGQMWLQFVDDQGFSARVPNITTVLQDTMPFAQKMKYLEYRQAFPEEAKFNTSRGSRIHSFIKNSLLGKPSAYPEDLRPWEESVRETLSLITGQSLVEGCVVHRTELYAGVVDFVGTFSNFKGTILTDWKSRQELRTEFDDEKLQAAAYFKAMHSTYKDEVSELQSAMIVDILPSPNKTQFHLISREEIEEELYPKFLHRLKLFRNRPENRDAFQSKSNT